MDGISIVEDDKCVTAIFARIDDDDRALTSCALEIGEARGKKDLRLRRSYGMQRDTQMQDSSNRTR